MQPLDSLTTGTTHQVYAVLRRLAGRSADDDSMSTEARDRGAVSLEQVLWFVAAGVSVAVIAAILWNQIRDTAEEPVVPPTSP